MKLIAQVCMYNEVEKGNLDRCLDNLKRYCDDIIIYDDASTDDSVAVAGKYTKHIIRGETNDQLHELAHKQVILEKSLELGATHLFWLDCDEVLDRPGTLGGLRNLCDNWPEGVDAFSFRETNLWRSENHVRIDSLFDKGRFVRLWQVTPDIHFEVNHGVHLRLYPATIQTIREAPMSVIHYGFCNYKKLMEKVGVHVLDGDALRQCAINNWILNEEQCSCYKLPDEYFPPGCLPPDIWPSPHSKPIDELVEYNNVNGDISIPMIDMRSLKEWQLLHSHNYHGGLDSVHLRNKNLWDVQHKDDFNRASLFRFNPDGKIIYDVASGTGTFALDCIVNGAEKIYGFEIDHRLLDQVKQSFTMLEVPEEKYEFVDMATLTPEGLPSPDIIYCMAMFMHVPWWQGKRYLQWYHEVLKDDGRLHLQVYEDKGQIMFWNSLDSIGLTRFMNEIERIGFEVVGNHWFAGNTEYPVWNLYEFAKKGN